MTGSRWSTRCGRAGQPSIGRTLDDDCLIAFTEMAGVTSREDIAAQADSQRWHNVDIKVAGFLQPTDEVAILTYRASAVRGENEPYDARVSRAYVKRRDGGKMTFHQRTTNWGVSRWLPHRHRVPHRRG